MKSSKGLLIGGGVIVLGLAYYLYSNKAAAASSGSTGSVIGSGYSGQSPVSIANIGGSNGTNGTVIGNNIGNSFGGTTPISFDVANGTAINSNTGQQVDPSSWQGTTNKSGSLTYLNGALGGEGSSQLALQGVTY